MLPASIHVAGWRLQKKHSTSNLRNGVIIADFFLNLLSLAVPFCAFAVRERAVICIAVANDEESIHHSNNNNI